MFKLENPPESPARGRPNSSLDLHDGFLAFSQLSGDTFIARLRLISRDAEHISLGFGHVRLGFGRAMEDLLAIVRNCGVLDLANSSCEGQVIRHQLWCSSSYRAANQSRAVVLTTDVQHPRDHFCSAYPPEEGERGPDGAKVLACDAENENLGVG